jgi:hypothetical protein
MTESLMKLLPKKFHRSVEWLRNNLLLVFFVCFTGLVIWTYSELNQTDKEVQESRQERIVLARQSDIRLCQSGNRQDRNFYENDLKFWKAIRKSITSSIRLQESLVIPGFTEELREQSRQNSLSLIRNLKPQKPEYEKCNELPITELLK